MITEARKRYWQFYLEEVWDILQERAEEGDMVEYGGKKMAECPFCGENIKVGTETIPSGEIAVEIRGNCVHVADRDVMVEVRTNG